MHTLRRIVPLLVVGLLLFSPWPGYGGKKAVADLNDRFLTAAQQGQFAEVKKLVEQGANVNVRGKYGDTALLFATLNGDDQTVQLLLSKGAEVNTRNNVGDTALVMATEGKEVGIVKLLLAHKADVNSKRYDGATPLMIASQQADLETVQLLLSHGAQANEKDNSGRTALDYTAFFDVAGAGTAKGQKRKKITLRGMAKPTMSEGEHTRLEQVRSLLRQHGAQPGTPQ